YSAVQTYGPARGTGTAMFHTSSGLGLDTAYTFRARAHNVIGDSPYSDPITGTTAPVAPTITEATAVPGTDDQVRLTWTDNSRHEDGFQVYYKAPADAGFTYGTSAAASD